MLRCATVFVLCVGCSSPKSVGVTALFAVPGSSTGDDFYALPYPNDLHRHADGSLDLSEFPTNALIVGQYLTAAESLDGFGLNATMFARFDGPIDPMTLPDAAGSITATASVYVVDVDPKSPNLGKKSPVIATFRPAAGQTIKTNSLAVRPYPGFGLDEGTTYALVVTRRVTAADGSDLETSDDMRALLGTGGNDAIVAARMVYQPLLDYLDQPGDDERTDVLSAAVFTTQHATFVAPAIRKGVFASDAPIATDVVVASTPASFTEYTGNYTAPNFQTGDVPYRTTGGEILVGADGAAIVQRIEPMRFALTIPPGTMPANGWPYAIYQHGTGGDYQSFIDDGTGARLAAQGIATISTDQVLHGPRNPGGDPDIDFFNFENPLAARDNALQGVADAFSQLRLANGLAITGGIKLDPTKVLFFGHSQGGLTGPGFVAFEPSLSGAVFSGTGGLIYLGLLYKKQPVDISSLAETLVRDEPFDENNPSIALLQMWLERPDGCNFAKFMVREPQTAADGTPIKPRNIFQTEGFIDTYAPNPGIEAFATAVGGDLVKTVDEADVPGLTQLRSRSVMTPPFSNNLNGATAVLAQYKQAPDDDGHFVVFDIPAAQMQSAQFLGTLASTGTATVVSAQ